MKNGKCPQCGATTVHSRPGGLGFGNTDKVYIYTGTMGKPSTTRAYICVTCGYYEVYLTDKDFLGEVARSWPKVQFKG